MEVTIVSEPDAQLLRVKVKPPGTCLLAINDAVWIGLRGAHPSPLIEPVFFFEPEDDGCWVLVCCLQPPATAKDVRRELQFQLQYSKSPPEGADHATSVV